MPDFRWAGQLSQLRTSHPPLPTRKSPKALQPAQKASPCPTACSQLHICSPLSSPPRTPWRKLLPRELDIRGGWWSVGTVMITLIDVANVQPRGWKAREKISRGWAVAVAQESNEKADPVHGLFRYA